MDREGLVEELSQVFGCKIQNISASIGPMATIKEAIFTGFKARDAVDPYGVRVIVTLT